MSRKTAKFTVEIVLSTVRDGELPHDRGIENAISTGIYKGFDLGVDVLSCVVTNRTGEL